MKIEKRNNIDLLLPFKINVSPGNFRKIQHILFSKGCEWKNSGKVLFSMHFNYIFVDKNKKISLGAKMFIMIIALYKGVFGVFGLGVLYLLNGEYGQAVLQALYY